MGRVMWQVFYVFIILSAVSAFLGGGLGLTFGTVSYWQNHGILFLIFMFIFPRVTLLFSSVASGGVFWWLGWLICPRLLTATLATFAYWHTNKLLVVGAWLWALGLEGTEKVYVRRRVQVMRDGGRKIRPGDPDVIDIG